MTSPTEIVIMANGELSGSQIQIPAGAILIAADGGGQHCLALGLIPQIVIGDFDSLNTVQLEALQRKGAHLIRHPAEKDETDLELALEQAVQLGAQRVTLYGLLGGRWDMSFANLLLLATPRYASLDLRVVAGQTLVYLLRAGQTLEINGQPGDTVSVIPLQAGLRGLTYHGLQWPLENASLPFGTPRGVSNRLTDQQARITLAEGQALVFVQPPDLTNPAC